MHLNFDALNFQDKAQFIWQVADDILFGPFMHNEFKGDLLNKLIKKFVELDLHPDQVSNHEMG